MPRLDGLRGIAILGVLAEHFNPSKYLSALAPGGAGVTLFFVLSGFLITRILLSYRDGGMSPMKSARIFYWRRMLRLSPPFYVAIAAASALGLAHMRELWWVHVFYLTNFRIAYLGEWGGAGHFWSLCVEEQFYLLWFAVVVVAPRRLLPTAILAGAATTLAIRTGVYMSGANELAFVLLPGDLFSLTTGALLAHASGGSGGLEPWIRLAHSRRALVVIGAAFVLASASVRFSAFSRELVYPFVTTAFFACLVAQASSARSDSWLDWLKSRPLRHIGKISYGAYVYHQFLPEAAALSPATKWLAAGGWFAFAVLTAGTLLLAQISWMLLERPALRLKDKPPFWPAVRLAG